MKKRLPPDLEEFRVDHPMYIKPEEGSMEGCFKIPYGSVELTIISGCGGSWDHVSVSTPHRCPSWDEMCFIKNLFFEEDELVLQFHPPIRENINICTTCLHLWRPWNQKIELPPRWMLG